MDYSSKKRIEIVLKTPNPLFEKWLHKWLEQAKEKGSKSRYTITEALDSLKRFPLPLTSGKDCAILRGFGPTLCNLIDQELKLLEQTNSSQISAKTYDEDMRNVVKSVQKAKKRPAALPQKVKPKSKKLDAGKSCPSFSTTEIDEQVLMSPGSFKIILLVDTQETNGKSKKFLDDTRQFIESYKIEYEVRRLSVGDFAWICRDEKNNELVLPYIVERKRMDDFASSIRDGRFHEQKFRLRDCGIQNLIYLIENYGNNQHVGLPMPTLMQAAINTQIHSGFKIKFTDSLRDSILYLNVMTKIITKNFHTKVLIGTAKEDLKPSDITSNFVGLLKFQEFQQSSVKCRSFKVKEIFMKQLLQLKTLSVDKVLAISTIYPTPRSLILAYNGCSTKEEAELLLAAIPCGQLKRPIGAALSKTIYNFYQEEF